MNLSWLSNPEIFQVNRLKAHSSHHYYANEEEKQSSLIHVLDGTWKFHYANALNEVIEGFEKNRMTAVHGMIFKYRLIYRCREDMEHQCM